LLSKILNFLRAKNPDVIVQAPSRINLINPLDAVEGDFWMPSVAINGIENPLSVFLYIKESRGISKIKIFSCENNGKQIKLHLEDILTKDIFEFRKKLYGNFKLIYASIYRFYKTCPIFWEKFKEKNFELGLISTIPKGSGLGGSAAIIIAAIYGLAKFFKIYNNLSCISDDELPINKDIIAEMATKVEDEDLRITAGYSDRYVICRGGLGFCSYYGKLHHKELSLEPLAVYDRIDKIYDIKDLPIIICFSGIQHDSGNVHDKLRKLYLQEDPKIIKGYERLAEISWKSRFTLMSRNWKRLGLYLKENTRIMNDIMKDAGFKYGIGLANNILITLIEDHPHVHAVKLTGAGGGGSVFALVEPNKIDIVLMDWKNRLKDIINNINSFKALFPSYPIEIRNNLKNAKFFRIKINDGVKEINLN